MIPAFFLACLISIPAMVAHHVILHKLHLAIIWDNPNANYRFYLMFTTPLIEETIRVAAVAYVQRLGWFLNPSMKTAALIGFFVGLIEFFYKSTFDIGEPKMGLLFTMNASSLLIHTALFCAFFSFRTNRFLKTLGLHCLLNTIPMVIDAILLRSEVTFSASPVEYTVVLVAVSTVASLALLALTLGRMRHRHQGDVHG